MSFPPSAEGSVLAGLFTRRSLSSLPGVILKRWTASEVDTDGRPCRLRKWAPRPCGRAGDPLPAPKEGREGRHHDSVAVYEQGCEQTRLAQFAA